MTMYCIGDVQGCSDALNRLLRTIDFSPSRDHLFVLGDLVNRGPDSQGVLRRLMALGPAATCLLGNHDLHLLAVASGARPAKRLDTLDRLLQHGRRQQWIEWLRHRPLAWHSHGVMMVHAGVAPQWDVTQTLALAEEVSRVLRGPDLPDFLHHMYGNTPDRWNDALQGHARLRLIVNALTRMRFCREDGTMDFSVTDGADAAPPGFLPWFDVPTRRTRGCTVAFGHWSTLGLINRPDVIALDTGCVWGGCLSAMELGTRRVAQVRCAQAQTPGA